MLSDCQGVTDTATIAPDEESGEEQWISLLFEVVRD